MSSASNPYPMPPATADLATTWAFLEEGVDHIMTKLQTGGERQIILTLYTPELTQLWAQSHIQNTCPCIRSVEN